jgi:hypothetical protein
MSPARIPDDDSLRAPLFSTLRRPPKNPSSPRQEHPKSAPPSDKESEIPPRASRRLDTEGKEDRQ